MLDAYHAYQASANYMPIFCGGEIADNKRDVMTITKRYLRYLIDEKHKGNVDVQDTDFVNKQWYSTKSK